MSPLTKLLVALHVLLSLMLAAGVVVFVNKAENFKTTQDTIQAQLASATAMRDSESARRAAEAAASATQIETVRNSLSVAETARQAADQRSADQAASVADLQAKLAVQQANANRLGEGLKSSQDNQAKLNDALNEMRAMVDKMVVERAELNARVSDLTNNLEVTERERRFASEQLAQSKVESNKLAGELERLGYNPRQISAPAAVVAVRPPAINGVVRDTRNVEGIAYATISVGSSDSVTQGMQFTVVDRDSAAFLGILTVDSVEANEATGRLSGPAIDRIGPGSEVLTKL